MKLNWLTLTFSGDSSKLETPFQSDYCRGSLRHVRISLVLGALLYATFGILDAILMTEQKHAMWLIRFIITCPIILGTLLASFLKHFERHMQHLLAAVFIMAGAGIIGMIIIAPPPINYFYYAGLMLVFLWGYTFIRIRFLWATLAGWVLVLLYEIAAIWISPNPFTVMISNNFFFISANIIGMLSCYSIEFTARRDFFLRQQLEIEREKVNKVNQELETRVEKRTADYQIINQELQKEITDHKQVQEALRASEENYRLSLDGSPLGIRIVTAEGETIYANRAILNFYGYDSIQELTTTPVDKRYTPKSLAEYQTRREKRKRGDYGQAEYEIGIIRKNGELRNLQVFRKEVLWNGERQYQVVYQDITERRQVEETLRLVTDNMSDMVRVTDLGGVNLYTSPSHFNVLGYKPEERIGKSSFDIVHPDDVENLIRIFSESIANKKPVKVEYRIKHAAGHYLWLETIGDVLRNHNGEVTLIIMSSRDISDRKAVEEALRKSEDKYRLIAENTADLISIMDMNLRLTYVGPTSMRLRGFTPEEAMEQTPEQILTPESLQRNIAVFEEELQLEASGTADPDRTRILEMEEYKKDGSTIWVEVNFSFLRDSEGKPVEILMVTRDITDRRQVQEAQRILEERLQQTDKMEAIGTLAGGIAHDFNNLLMGIQGYASMSLLNIDTSHPNYERLKRIEEQVQSGADLTSQLLGFARGGRYEVKSTDINELIEKTSSMFGRTKKEITINKKYGSDLCPAEVDRGQMEQVFLNLYVNAWQAMPRGGEINLSTLNVILNDEQALLCSIKPGKYVKIAVTDTGTGMDEKTRERIFDPFFTTKEMGRGTGLGLATVYGIIKGHGGMINVESVPGKGSTFTIYLPASDKEAPKEEMSTGEITMGTETILLVDDEKMVMEVNKDILEYMGYKVYAADSGKKGIALYLEKKDEIDLVILDMIMPGISGGETFDRLRKINPNIKVLLSSGYSLTGEAQEIMDRGCNGFLQKPFQLEQLSDKVREMLG